MLNKVVPDDTSDNQYNCIICMDENCKTINHTCTNCKKNAWVICENCNQQLEKCPICRADINIVINLNDIHLNNEEERYKNRLINHFKNILYISYGVFYLLICFMICVYIGKIYLFSYCKFYDSSDDDYKDDSVKILQYDQCYSYRRREYWYTFDKKIFLECTLGLFTILICKIWKRVLNTNRLRVYNQ